MGQTDPNANQKYPQDIHQYIKATARAVSTSYFFNEVASDDLFQQVIDRYYQGKVDETTKRKLEK